jgi:hypothetical protein
MKQSYVVRAAPWEIFGIVVGGFVIGMAVMGFSRGEAFEMYGNFMSILVLLGGFTGWLFTLGKSLLENIPGSGRRSVWLFQFNVAYILVFSALFAAYVGKMNAEHNSGHLADIAIVAYLLHAYLLLALIQIYHRVAKSMIAFESTLGTEQSTYAATFIQLWFFPIGIWYLQPRIQRLFA